MTTKFQIDLEVPESRIEACRVSVQGDVETEGWQGELMRGVVEMIVMIDQMYGPDIADKALKARK